MAGVEALKNVCVCVCVCECVAVRLSAWLVNRQNVRRFDRLPGCLLPSDKPPRPCTALTFRLLREATDDITTLPVKTQNQFRRFLRRDLTLGLGFDLCQLLSKHIMRLSALTQAATAWRCVAWRGATRRLPCHCENVTKFLF